jgi:hypothetical protein
LDKQAHHCEVLNLDPSRITEAVDSAGIEGKRMLLPGEISKTIVGKAEKSAEAIVAEPNHYFNT